MTEGGFCLPLTPSAAFPTSLKPSKAIRKNGTAWGVQIVHHLVLSCSFSRELLQTIMTLTMLSEAGSVSALYSAIIKEGSFVVGQLDHFEELLMSCRCSFAARYPAVSLGPLIAAVDTSVFGGLLRRVTEQGFDVSRQGTHSSSPQHPHQIWASGWRRSGANNNSTALCGVRSTEESTITWKKGNKKQQVKLKGMETVLMSHR